MSRRSYDTLECFSGNTGVSLQWQHGTREPIYTLGKGQYCPRDGRLDCSIVDALEASQLPGPSWDRVVMLPWLNPRMIIGILVDSAKFSFC